MNFRTKSKNMQEKNHSILVILVNVFSSQNLTKPPQAEAINTGIGEHLFYRNEVLVTLKYESL